MIARDLEGFRQPPKEAPATMVNRRDFPMHRAFPTGDDSPGGISQNLHPQADAQDGQGVAESTGEPHLNNNQKILELYNAGKDNIDIARELNLGLGEVRLVIDLYKTRGNK